MTGLADRDGRERSRDRGKERERNRDRDDRDMHHSRSTERDRGRDRDRDYNYDRHRDHGRDKEKDWDRDRNRHRYWALREAWLVNYISNTCGKTVVALASFLDEMSFHMNLSRVSSLECLILGTDLQYLRYFFISIYYLSIFCILETCCH